jgi:TPR repeat protein
MSLDAFVSYASPDRAFAMELVKYLEARELKCWIAPRDVPGGQKYAEVILKGLSDSGLFLLVFSKHSNASEHVQREVERALHLSKIIIPVRIADLMPSGSMDYYLATLHWLDAFGADNEVAFDQAAHAVADGLGRELTEPSGTSASASTTPSASAPSQPAPKPALKRPLIYAAIFLTVVAAAGFAAWQTFNPTPPPEPEKNTVADQTPVSSNNSTAPLQTKNPKPPPPPRTDPVALAVALSNKAWQAGDHDSAITDWKLILNLPAGELTQERLGNSGIELLREMITVAAEEAETGAGVDFESLESWRPLVDLSARLNLTDLATLRTRFTNGWQIAQAESLWARGDRDDAAKTLTQIAGPNGAALTNPAKDRNSPLGKQLDAVLDQVVIAADEGSLGAIQIIEKKWQPSLQLAAQRDNPDALGVLANLAWNTDDYDSAAAFLTEFETATRGTEILNPTVGAVLKKALQKAQTGTAQLLTDNWEPAFTLAYAHQLPDSLRILARVTHARNPGEAAPLFRTLYTQNIADISVRQHVVLCLDMLDHYDVGAEAAFYRSELEKVCEATLAEIDHPSSKVNLIEEVPEIRQAADSGIPAAQYIMGDLLSEGKGLERNETEAFDFFQKSAAAGYARAKYAVGECYRDGRGTTQNPKEALRIWNSLSAEDITVVPQVLLSLAQMTPPGDDQDRLYAQARSAYETKVAAGQAARYGGGLGFMLLNGKGGAPEHKRAYELLNAAAENGEVFATFLVGFLLVGEEQMFVDMRQEIGIERDPEKGINLMKSAARDGYLNAQTWCQQNNISYEE